jgi:hypothetical protein
LYRLARGNARKPDDDGNAAPDCLLPGIEIAARRARRNIFYILLSFARARPCGARRPDAVR